jgi:hypothetical protein
MLAGGLAVLIALGVLLRSITRERQSPVVSRTSAPVVARAPEPVAPQRPEASRPATVAPRTPAIRRPESRNPREPTRPSPPPPSLANDDAPPGTRYNTKNLQWGMPQLRQKIAANKPQIAACVRASGSRPTGNATVTFIVADRAGKIVVEEADIDHDATTLQDATLLDCFTKATSAMQFDGLPREAPAIVVTRTIALQDGSVVENKPAKFSYIR